MDLVTYLRCKKANESIVEDVMQLWVWALSTVDVNCLRLQIKATPGGVSPKRVSTEASPIIILGEIL